MADYLRTLMDGLCSEDQADLAALMAARSEADRREAAYLAALPVRMSEIAGEFSELLPDGMRLEWVTRDA
jgi:hypothetical protein